MYALLVGLFVYITTHLNSAKTVNIEVTLHQKEVFTWFNQHELWAVNYVNTSAGIVTANVVIEETKYKSLLSNKPSTMTALKTIYDNVEQVLDKEKSLLDNRTRWTSGAPRNEFFNQYRDWIEYEAFLSDFLDTFSDFASESFIGNTIQNRQIPMITLSSGGGSKPGFLIMAELHAREWLANAATMWIMNEFAEQVQDNNALAVEILDNVNIFIVPTVNIDGYIYSWEVDRNWRKNRRNNGDGSFGVDLNRNYENPNFCGTGASSNPSSNTYCGTGEFSEPETLATRNVITDESLNLQAAWDMHTFGELVMYPWAYTLNPAPNKQELEIYTGELQDVIQNVNGVTYIAQQAAEMYIFPGAASDYFYIAGIEDYPIIFEGRGPGFNPSSDNIIPSGQELYAGFILTCQKLYQG